MRLRSFRHVAIGAALGLAISAESAPASAQWISLSGPSKPGEVDGWTWLLSSMAALGALVPQTIGAVELRVGKPALTRGQGAGIFAGGTALVILDGVGLGFAESNQEAVLGAVVGGPFWSMMGAGLGRTISATAPRASWLGGSMGFTSFAVFHGAMATGGLSDFPGANTVQAIHAVIGGTGCFVDAAYSLGAERWTAVGCGVVAVGAFVHGVVKAARGDVTYRKKPPKHRAFVPTPWITREVTGLTLTGTF